MVAKGVESATAASAMTGGQRGRETEATEEQDAEEVGRVREVGARREGRENIPMDNSTFRGGR
jgi:hypothetical protein